MDRKLLFLGIDGVDPVILESMMERGEAPHFRRLAEAGRYNRLATIDPPQSPVVWTTIATGRDPGGHGIYDFIGRAPGEYAPALSLLRLDRFRYLPPVAARTFWEDAAGKGIPAVVLKYPVTFPPRSVDGRVLAGLGVPDLRGTLGLYTLFTDDASVDAARMKGRIVPVEVRGGAVRTAIPGPFALGTGGKEESSAAMTVRIAGRRVRCETGDQAFELDEGGWSEWIPVRFRLGFLRTVTGLCRFRLNAASPAFSLYMTPIHAAYDSAEIPLSCPRDYAGALARAIGPYGTLGISEDTNALNDGVLSDEAFLAMCGDVMDERERIFDHELARFERGILACVFDTTDRIQHMFYRARDAEHPLHDPGSADRGGDVIERSYRRMDAVVGRAMSRVGPRGAVMICSDHGFAPFRKAVHLNRWLAANGYLCLEDGRAESDGLFDGVDWSRTKAYALGLNGIYINLREREPRGAVGPGELPRVKEELAAALGSLSDGGRPVVRAVHDASAIYRGPETARAPDLVVGYGLEYRASWQTAVGGVPAGEAVEINARKWSGDHCCDASFVPGVFFSSTTEFPEAGSVLSVRDAILEWLGI